MNIINITLAFTFIIAYAIIIYLHLKKLKEKMSQVIEGEIENKPLNKLISKARAYSKKRFAVYMCFQGLLISTTVILVLIGIDLLSKSNEIGIIKYLFIFLSVASTVTGIAKANSIWQQVDN